MLRSKECKLPSISADMSELSAKSKQSGRCPLCCLRMLTGAETVPSHAAGWQHCAVWSFLGDGALEVKAGGRDLRRDELWHLD